MKKIGAFALAMTLAGSLAAPAFAAGEDLLISPNPNGGYTTAITINGAKLDASTLPAAEGIPMRLVVESDHGSAYWSEDEGTGSFSLEGLYVVVNFSTGVVSINDEAVDGLAAEVKDGVTYLPTSIFEGVEGYTVKAGDGTVDLTTPNSDPLVQLAYQVADASGAAVAMKQPAEALEQYQGLKQENFTGSMGLLGMNVTPDTVIVGKLAEGAKQADIEAQLETYRKGQEETFNWYLPQNLPKVENAKTVFEGGYVLFLIAEDADKGVEAFQNWVKAQ